ADDEQEPCFAGAEVALHPEVRQLIEGVVHPRHEDIVAGEALECRREVDIAMDVFLDLPHEFLPAAVFFRSAWEEKRAAAEQVVLRRKRHDAALPAFERRGGLPLTIS